MREFFNAFRLQCRVIGALVLREGMVKYGRENLGFAWVFIEPLIFVFPVLTMWHYLRPRYAAGGLLWADISWSGYLPLMLYRHLGAAALYAIRDNTGVLYHRLVTSSDIMAARTIVEIMSNFAAALFSLFVLMLVGEVRAPRDWQMFYIGYFYMAWWCAVVGWVVGGLSLRSIWVEKIWAPIGYMYIAVSGCFFLANWLPPKVRSVALIQPSIQAYEMIRCGMFGNEVPTYFDMTYDTMVLAVLTVFGLSFVRSARRYVTLV